MYNVVLRNSRVVSIVLALFIAILLVSSCSHHHHDHDMGDEERHKDYSSPKTNELGWITDKDFMFGINLDNNLNPPVRYHYTLNSANIKNSTTIGQGIGTAGSSGSPLSASYVTLDFETLDKNLTNYANRKNNCSYGYNLSIYDDYDNQHKFTTNGVTFNAWFTTDAEAWSADCFYYWHGFTISHSDAKLEDGRNRVMQEEKLYRSQYEVSFQFSSPTGAGSPGLSGTGSSNTVSSNFLVAYWAMPGFAFGQIIDTTINLPVPTKIESIDINNNIYAILSMENGDTFSKPFSNGDWFVIRLDFYDDKFLALGKLEVLLADYVNSPYYILQDWNRIPLGVFGDTVSHIRFSMVGSDSGANGLNIPAYILLDNIVLDRVR